MFWEKGWHMKRKNKNVLFTILSNGMLFFIFLLLAGLTGSYLEKYLIDDNSQIIEEDKNITNVDNNEKPSADKDSFGKNYYYELLSEQEKSVYDAIYRAFEDCNEEINLSTGDMNLIDRVFKSVLYDHPEIFWVDIDYTYKSYSSEKTEIIPKYLYTKSEIREQQKQIDQTVSKALSGISKNASDYNKIIYIYEYLVQLIQYDPKVAKEDDKKLSKEEQNIDSSLVRKVSVCAGYAKATKYLLDKLGVYTIYVAGPTHAWNIVKCDDEFYYVDTTWGDPYSDAPTEDKGNRINYDYLLCNEAMFTDHILDDGFVYPECKSLKNNYYVVNNRYFEEYNAEDVASLINNDISQKRDCTEIKFVSEKVYKTAIKDILENQAPKAALDIQKKYGSNNGYTYISNEDRGLVVIYWIY